MDQDSVDCIATSYWLHGPGIEFLCSLSFPHPSMPTRGPVIFLFKGYWAFAVSKTAGKWRWTLTPSNAEAKERVQLHLYSTSGHSWSVLRWNFTVTLFARNTEQTRTSGFVNFTVPTSMGGMPRTLQYNPTHKSLSLSLSYTYTIKIDHSLNIITSVEKTSMLCVKKI